MTKLDDEDLEYMEEVAWSGVKYSPRANDLLALIAEVRALRAQALTDEERAALLFARQTLNAKYPVFDIGGRRAQYMTALNTLDKLLAAPTRKAGTR